MEDLLELSPNFRCFFIPLTLVHWSPAAAPEKLRSNALKLSLRALVVAVNQRRSLLDEVVEKEICKHDNIFSIWFDRVSLVHNHLKSLAVWMNVVGLVADGRGSCRQI